MTYKEVLSKYMPILIIILLLSVVFLIRADTANLSGLTEEQKALYQDPDGLPYFSEMDSYYNYRLTENYINTGILGDTIQNGEVWDLHSYAPSGRAVDYPPLIVYITTLFYYIVNYFGDISLMEVAFWTGAIIASLCVIPAYLLVRRITNDYGGIAAALLVGLAIPYFMHTYAGFFDTDMFNMIFPLLIIYFFVLSVQAENIKKKSIFAVLSALSMLTFSLAWVGYIFYLALLTIVVIIYLIASHFILKNKPKSNEEHSGKLAWLLNQPELLSFLIFLGVGVILVGLLNGFSSISGALYNLAGANELQTLTQTSNYPNVYTTVSELQVAPWITTQYGLGTLLIPISGTIVGGVGGIIVFICGILGIGALIMKMRTKISSRRTKTGNRKPPKSKRKRIDNRKIDETETEEKTFVSKKDLFRIKRENLFYVVLFAVWLIITAYTTTKGSRFIATFALPVGLCAGIFIGFATDYIKENFKSTSTLALVAFIGATFAAVPVTLILGLSNVYALLIGIVAGGIVFFVKNDNIRTHVAMALILLAVITPTIAMTYTYAETSAVPSTNDDMYNAMQWVKKNTPNDTVLISWWDFGHFFTAVGDRGALFDGGTQNTPRAYWEGKAMLTSNESLSVGIFNMLATSGDTAYLLLDNYTKNTSKTTDILTATLGLSKENAKTVMIDNYNLTPEQAQNVLKYSHPDNPRPYVFVASSDMISKAGVWSNFGSWNFTTDSGTPSNYYSPTSAQQINSSNNTNGTNSTLLLFSAYADSSQKEILGAIVNQTANGTNASLIGLEMFYNENGTLSLNNSGNNTVPTHKVTIISTLKNGTSTIQQQIVDPDAEKSLLIYIYNGTVINVYAMDRALEDSMFTKLYLLSGYNQTSFKLVNMSGTVQLFMPT